MIPPLVSCAYACLLLVSVSTVAIAPNHGVTPDHGVTPNHRIAPNHGIAPDDRVTPDHGVTPNHGIAPDHGVIPDRRRIAHDRDSVSQRVIRGGRRLCGPDVRGSEIGTGKCRRCIYRACSYSEGVLLNLVNH